MDVVYAICSNGPIAGTVFSVDLLLIDVEITTDEGSFKYARVGFGTSEKAHRIAVFAYVASSIVR